MVRHYVRKRTYSTEDRVLVHLSAVALQPMEQTQDGIAAATRSGRSTLTKWLARLAARGLVTRSRIRLQGHALPRFSYHLTEGGWQAASRLRERLGSELVTVRAPNVGALPVRLVEVPNLAEARLNLTGIVAETRKGRIDLARVPPLAARRGPPVWGSGVHRIDRFFGRTRELSDLDRWWTSGSSLMVVTGLAGIGKSSLIAAWVQGPHLRAPVYAFEVRPSATVSGFLADFAAFLAAWGKPGLLAHLAQGVPLDPAIVSRLLDRDLKGVRLLVIIDNADQASRDLARVFKALLVEQQPGFRPKSALVGRRVPRWLSSQGSKPLDWLPLEGLDAAAARNLLRARGLGPSSSFVEDVVQRTHGHPFLLHLAASTGAGHGSELERYWEEQLWGTLHPKERTALEAASIFRTAASERALQAVSGADARILEGLAERNLLERNLAGGYVMHDLVSEFIAARLPVARRKRLHARAAQVLLQMSDSHDRWEGLFHLLESGEVREAATLLDSEGAPLMDCVAAEDIASLVRRIPVDETETWAYCVFAETLGDSLRIRGHTAPALFQYGHALRFAERVGQAARMPRILRKMAFLERCRNRYSKALGYLLEARARLAEVRNPLELAEVLRETALSEQSLGHLDDASRYLSEAVDLATEAANPAALARTMLALGSLETQRGRLSAGLDLTREGLRAAERSGNLTEIAHAHIVVGSALISAGKAEESLKHLTEGYAAARLLGNLRLLGYSAANETSALLRLRRYQQAADRLQEAKDCFGILEERDAVGFLKTYEGEIEMGRGRWPRALVAWREGITELRSHGSPAELGLVLCDVAGFCLAHGDAEEGKSYLEEARKIAQKVGNGELLSRVDSSLRSLPSIEARADRD